MEYKKIINLLENTLNQPNKFKTKNWVEIYDDAHGTYNTNGQIKFKTSMLRSGLCDYSDAYILVSGTRTVTAAAAVAAGKGNKDIQVVFKNCAPFTDCISEINNTQTTHNSKDIDVVMPMHNLRKYSTNYSKTSGRFWQYYREEPAVTAASTLDHFAVNALFKFNKNNRFNKR